MSADRPFVIAPGPHVRAAESTASIMWWVNAALAPATLWGVFVFGLPALEVILAALAGAAAAEWLAGRALKLRPTLGDGSAVCTGLLLALTLPPLVPPWMALLGGAFAIGIGKMIFGGLGMNLFNPALIGRAFMLAPFPLPMTSAWSKPHPIFAAPLDAVTTATPLAALDPKLRQTVREELRTLLRDLPRLPAARRQQCRCFHTRAPDLPNRYCP